MAEEREKKEKEIEEKVETDPSKTENSNHTLQDVTLQCNAMQ